MPPLSPADMEAIRRLIKEEVGPVKQRVDTHSGQYREIAPTVKGLRDSQHDIEDRNMGFERLMMQTVGRLEQKVDVVTASIPPAAAASAGAEAAAVAGAKASIQGATAAIDGKTNALAAKVSANRALIIVVIQTVLIALWQTVQWLLAHAGVQ